MHQLQFLLHKQHLSLNVLCHDLLFHAVSVLKSSLSAFTPILCSKGVFTWYWGDLPAGASSLQFPIMALNLFTWYHHEMSCRCKSPRREFTEVIVPEREFLSKSTCMRQWDSSLWKRNFQTFHVFHYAIN